MLNHMTLGAQDVSAAKKFYDAALGILGYKCIHQEHDNGRLAAVGYGLTKAFFWICLPADEKMPSVPCNGNHYAFEAQSQQQVHDFYDAALANGGVDEGAPGPRPQYHDKYYAAFVRDPAGHKIEIVFGNG